jgi:hypothetical protein
MCRAPEPAFRQILEDVRELRFAAYPPGGGQQELGIVLHSRAPLVAEEDDLALGAGRL